MTAVNSDTFCAVQRPVRSAPIGGARRRAADETGQGLVELALILPVLLMLVFGIVQFALALNSANDETHLANEVARYAAVNERPTALSLAAWGLAQASSKELSGEKVCISFPENNATKTTGQIGDPVEVVVSGAIKWMPVLKLTAASTSVTGKAVMRLEAPPTAYGAECT
jgi:Flp pilus assembly protein TadG